MPALAQRYTVIAPDLRGLDSSKPLTGYDGKTVAEDIHQLVTNLGFKTIFLVGHDIGGQIAYSYAAAHPTEVKRLVVSDLTFPGFAPPGRMTPWWFVFHQTPDIPEALVQGKEPMYLSWFYHNLAIENQNYSKTKLRMPVLAVYGSYYPVFGGNVTVNPALYSMKALTQNVRGIQIPNSSHWSPEEQPEFIIKLLDGFFGGNTANTSASDPILRNQQVLAASSCVHACTIHVGSGPTGIAFDPKNGNHYVTNSSPAPPKKQSDNDIA